MYTQSADFSMRIVTLSLDLNHLLLYVQKTSNFDKKIALLIRQYFLSNNNNFRIIDKLEIVISNAKGLSTRIIL